MNILDPRNPDKVDFAMKILTDLPELGKIRNKFFKGISLSNNEVSQVLSSKGRYAGRRHLIDSLMVMVDWRGLKSLEALIKDTIDNHIEGDFIETGVWKGGVCILAKCIYDKYRVNKKVFVADSFEGLPKPSRNKYPFDAGDQHYKCDYLKVDLDQVKNNFRLFNCLDDNVIFVKGFFRDTMPTIPVDKLSILRLDGDMYESTINVLDNLYPKLSIGGYCIIDDYFHRGCRQAIRDYRRKMKFQERIIKVDEVDNLRDEVHYWKKTKQVPAL